MAWKITDLPVGTTPLTGGELFEMVQEGESYSVPVSGFAGLNHNTLSNIQGGIPSASEYYHLSQLIHDSLFSASPTIGVGINGQANMQVDYGNDHVSFYMDAGEGQGYSQIIDMDGDAGNSEINLGLQTEVYQQIGIGSAPNIRMRSGSDTWFYVDSDDQRLGNNTAGSTYFQANSSGEAWINAQGVRHFEADQENLYLGDKDAVSTATYIHINADNSIMDFYVHNGGILLHLDDSGTITLGPTATTQIVMDQVTGDFYWYGIIDEPVPTFQPIIHFDESSSYLKLGNQNHTYIYLREMDDSSDGSVRIYAADDIQLSPTNEVVIDIGGGVNEFTVDSAGVTLTKGVTIDEFSNDTTLSGSSPSATPTENAVKTYVDNEIVLATIPHWTPFASAGSYPQPVVLNGLSVSVFTIGGSPSAAIRASDIISSVITNNDPPYTYGVWKIGDMPVYYSDPDDAVLVLDCTDHGAGTISLEVGVKDNSANEGIVESYVLVQDFYGACP